MTSVDKKKIINLNIRNKFLYLNFVHRRKNISCMVYNIPNSVIIERTVREEKIIKQKLESKASFL